jgi:hypothetical protein
MSLSAGMETNLSERASVRARGIGAERQVGRVPEQRQVGMLQRELRCGVRGRVGAAMVDDGEVGHRCGSTEGRVHGHGNSLFLVQRGNRQGERACAPWFPIQAALFLKSKQRRPAKSAAIIATPPPFR